MEKKTIRHILKNELKNKCVCFNKIMLLVAIEMKMIMKKRSHDQDINRPRTHIYQEAVYMR